MAVKGAQFLDLQTLLSHPQPGVRQIDTGGILDAIEGTLILTALALALAVPLGVIAALWVVEYGRPRWLARMIESGIEIVAGTPDIVIAIFGLALFQLPLFGVLSFTASGGGVFGRSFIAAGAMLSLIALPVVYANTREGLMATPGPAARGVVGAGQDADLHDPRGAAAAVAAQHLHRRRAGHGPDHRRHGDRPDPARRDAPDLARERHAGRRAAARDRLDADDVRLRRVAGGRGQRAAEGLRRRVRPARSSC